MTRFALLCVASISLLACEHPLRPVVSLPDDNTARSAAAPAPAARYKLRLIAGVNPAGDGELVSAWFPDSGIALNVRSPWKTLVVSGAIVELVNFTHGDWNGGTCASFRSSATIVPTNWDIAGTSPVRSFAGSWYGTLSISQKLQTSIAFDGDRIVDGIVTPSAGGIHNVVSNGNAAFESRDPSGNNDWFQLELRNAALKFGSASSPDGLGNPAGAEVACANLTIVAQKATLVTP